ncbi:hypothetical protein VTK56DRAFT_655 [Thermocarpiscus australiensis]
MLPAWRMPCATARCVGLRLPLKHRGLEGNYTLVSRRAAGVCTFDMPTLLDKAMRSKNAFLAFTGLVTGVAVWAIWGGDMFPPEPDPKGDPETWTREELRRWLAARDLRPQDSDSREQLLERVRANMRIPRQ